MTRVLVLCLAWLVTTPAHAGILGPGSFEARAGLAAPYWDHPSWDGPGQNVGEQHPGLSAYGRFGAPVPFVLADVFNLHVTLVSETSDYAGVNRFGWFEIGAPTWGELFPGAASAGAGTFTPPVRFAQLGLWLLSPAGFFTSVDDPEHFALFQESPTSYLLGMEDLTFRRTDQDYNDLVVRLRFVTDDTTPLIDPVPEPASLSLLALGLVALVHHRRRGQP